MGLDCTATEPTLAVSTASLASAFTITDTAIGVSSGHPGEGRAAFDEDLSTSIQQAAVSGEGDLIFSGLDEMGSSGVAAPERFFGAISFVGPGCTKSVVVKFGDGKLGIIGIDETSSLGCKVPCCRFGWSWLLAADSLDAIEARAS